MADKKDTGPAWGYDAKTGEAKLFEDGKLPKGFVDTPAKVKNGNGK